MTTYFSLTYLILLLPLFMLFYGLSPRKARPWVLLGCSYLVFWLFSQGLIVYILLSTASVYFLGIQLKKLQEEKKLRLSNAEKTEKKAIKAEFQKKMRVLLTIGTLFNLGILLVLKYTGFFGENMNSLLSACGSTFRFEIPRFLMPMGLSFYSLQAVSYLADVYRGTIAAETNPGKLGLFMCFFPQIMEGPICRYSQTADALWSGNPITYRNMTFGLQRILFGVMKKIVVADRLEIYIKEVFARPELCDGGMIALAMVCYTIQLYMEFSGTMDLVIGSGEIFGVTMPENFQRPFFSHTISEFWMRWHITLGAWFRDYLFYPVSMSKPLKHLSSNARKKLGNHLGQMIPFSIALFCVWISNGLWHGAGWQYIFFGMFHFVLILTGNFVEPVAQKICEKCRINRKSWWYQGMQILRTVVLVNIGELFFRAESLSKGMFMFQTMVSHFALSNLLSGGIFELGLGRRGFFICFVTVLIVFMVSLLQERGIRVRESIARQKLPVRWMIYYALLFYIVIFGAYGYGYVPVDPIYANF